MISTKTTHSSCSKTKSPNGLVGLQKHWINNVLQIETALDEGYMGSKGLHYKRAPHHAPEQLNMV